MHCCMLHVFRLTKQLGMMGTGNTDGPVTTQSAPAAAPVTVIVVVAHVFPLINPGVQLVVPR